MKLKKVHPARRSKRPRRMAQEPSNISEERILQISNDVSESMCVANRADLMAVVMYWAGRATENAVKLAALRSEIEISRPYSGFDF